MKVLFFYYKYPLYPRGSYFQEFLNTISGSLERVYLVATRHPKGDFDKPSNLEIFWLPLLDISFLGELFFMLTVLLKVIFTKKLSRVDVVNTIGPRGLLAGWYLKKRFGIPLVCTIEMLNEKGRLVDNLYYAFVRFLLTKTPVDRFICWSNYYWENHLKQWGIPKSRVVIIPAGIDTDVYNPSVDGTEIKNRYAPDTPLIVFAKPLYSTNTAAAKLLVRAVAILKPRIRLKLLIGGGEGERYIRDLAQILGVSDQVSFMPPTPFPEIPKYIAAADLVVLPFTYAPTTSRSLLEAMALGKAVITTPVGEVGRILEHRRHAIFVEPSSQEIAVAIQELLGDENLSAKIGLEARRLVESGFSLITAIERTVGVFKNLNMDSSGLYGRDYYESHEFSFRCREREDHDRILQLLNLSETDRVLEIGCGFGVLLEKIPSKNKVG